MAEFIVGKSLSDEDVLWRYLPLEAFISMLDTNSLYFSPLHAYKESDPYEGYIPRVAMEALASVSSNGQKQILKSIDLFEQRIGPGVGVDEIAAMREDAMKFNQQRKEDYKNIMSCLMVNCWHKNKHESEAMWGLYSRSGVAIRTTVGSIKAALQNNRQDHTIHIGSIKYLDFADESLKPSDCITSDGHIMGMLKRVAFIHENEVRMFITRKAHPSKLASLRPEATSVEIEVARLIEEVVISPVASPVMRDSITAIAKRYGIDQGRIRASPLRDGSEHLLNAFD